MIDFTPAPIAIQIGPLPVYWYGIAYALGLAAAYAVMVRQAARYGQDPNVVGNGLIVIGIAALIGGRLYHVVDQWALYGDDLAKIVLPPYSGLGVYGGLVTGTIAFLVLVRLWRLSPWTWADIVAPGLFAMQAVARWGNFFNQELYGPPTTLPWGIAIGCEHRVEPYGCDAFPLATTHFQPLFLYESLSGLAGLAVLLWLARRRPSWLRSGDLLLIFFIWYAVVRFALEFLRLGPWTLEGVPTAQVFSILFIVGALAVLWYRHAGPGAASATRPAQPETGGGPEETASDPMVGEGVLAVAGTPAAGDPPATPAAPAGTVPGSAQSAAQPRKRRRSGRRAPETGGEHG